MNMGIINVMTNKLWQEFIKWGSGFNIEAERDYKKKDKPFIYHLFMYGLHYENDYELIGKNLDDLLKTAIKDGELSVKKFKKSK